MTPRHRTTFVYLTAVLLLLTACAQTVPTPTATAPVHTAQPTANKVAIPTVDSPTSSTQPSATTLPQTAIAPQASPSPATAEPTTVTKASTTAVPTTASTATINGVPVSDIIVLPPETIAHVREIYARGQEYGRNPHAFSKLGDSAVLVSSYLTRFDDPTRYTLGDWDYLQPTIDYYAGSFRRYGVATRLGLSSWGVFDPTWANKTYCQPNEHMLACEFRLFNPSVLLIHLGTNDVRADGAFANNLRDILDYCLDQGVIPVLATKADRFEGDNNRNNQIIIELAAEYQVPLWHFDAVAATLPDRGLDEDNVHLTIAPANDYTDPETWRKGYPVSDLTALLTLDAIRQTVETVQP